MARRVIVANLGDSCLSRANLPRTRKLIQALLVLCVIYILYKQTRPLAKELEMEALRQEYYKILNVMHSGIEKYRTFAYDAHHSALGRRPPELQHPAPGEAKDKSNAKEHPKIIIGIPTVAREGDTYLNRSLDSLLAGVGLNLEHLPHWSPEKALDNYSEAERDNVRLLYALRQVLKIVIYNGNLPPQKHIAVQELVARFQHSLGAAEILEVVNPPVYDLATGELVDVQTPNGPLVVVDNIRHRYGHPELSKPDTIPLTHNDNFDRVMWRSKQSLDFATLMRACARKGWRWAENIDIDNVYYMQLEDDVTYSKNFLSAILDFLVRPVPCDSQAAQRWWSGLSNRASQDSLASGALLDRTTSLAHPARWHDWIMLAFYVPLSAKDVWNYRDYAGQFYGFIGQLFHVKDLEMISDYFRENFYISPVDWLMDDYIKTEVSFRANHSNMVLNMNSWSNVSQSGHNISVNNSTVNDTTRSSLANASHQHQLTLQLERQRVIYMHQPTLFQHIGWYSSLTGKIQDSVSPNYVDSVDTCCFVDPYSRANWLHDYGDQLLALSHPSLPVNVEEQVNTNSDTRMPDRPMTQDELDMLVLGDLKAADRDIVLRYVPCIGISCTVK